MSTLTRVDSNSGRKPQYKDYVAFLDNYRNGKKDEINSVTTTDSGVSFSLTNSSNNSSNSIFSDLNGHYDDTERTDTHKFNAIRTNLNKTSTAVELPRKTLKSEIVIEVKDPSPVSFQKTNKVFQLHNLNNADVNKTSYPQLHQKSNVSEVSKKFEDRRDSESGVKSNIIPGCHIPKEAIGKKNSIGEISKKFEQDKESSPIKNCVNQDVEHNKIINKKATNVNEVSKIFQNKTTAEQVTHKTTIPKPKVFNNIPKPFVPTNAVNNGSIKPVLFAAKPSCVYTKPLITSPKPSCWSLKPTLEDMLPPKVSISATSAVPTPPEPPTSYNSCSSTEHPKVCNEGVIIPPAPPLPSQESTFIPPPPPPLPIIFNLSRPIVHETSTPKVKSVVYPTKVVSQNIVGNNNDLSNGIKVAVYSNGHGGDDLADGKPIDLKKDPRVKKAVYGALRGMYGSYHDKANEFIATIPKNRVKKNNGLDSIIDSIKCQGGLEKLSGRANPDPEVA